MSIPRGARKVCESSENGVYADPVMMRHPLPLPHHFHNHCHRYPRSHCHRRHYLLANPVKNSPSPPLPHERHRHHHHHHHNHYLPRHHFFADPMKGSPSYRFTEIGQFFIINIFLITKKILFKLASGEWFGPIFFCSNFGASDTL